ncbi:MAG: transketolase C-terminal domain-containing protein [Ferrimicrobium sp.]
MMRKRSVDSSRVLAKPNASGKKRAGTIRVDSVLSQSQYFSMCERAIWWETWIDSPKSVAARGYRSGALAEIGVAAAFDQTSDLLLANRSLAVVLGTSNPVAARWESGSVLSSMTARAMVAVGAAFYRKQMSFAGAVVAFGDESTMPLPTLIEVCTVAVREKLRLIIVWQGAGERRWLARQIARSLQMSIVVTSQDDLLGGFGAGVDAWQMACGMEEPSLIILGESASVLDGDSVEPPFDIPEAIREGWRRAAGDAIVVPRVVAPVPEALVGDTESHRTLDTSRSDVGPSRDGGELSVAEAYRATITDLLMHTPDLVYVHGDAHSKALSSLAGTMAIPGESLNRLSVARGVVLAGGSAIVSVDNILDDGSLLRGVDGSMIVELVRGEIPSVPGVPVVAPSTPADVVGTLMAGRQMRGPMIVLLDPWLARHARGLLSPPGTYVVPIGSAVEVLPGTDATVFTWGRGRYQAEAAARVVQSSHHRSICVIDLRSLAPLDRAMIAAVARETTRVCVLEGSDGVTGVEVVSVVVEDSWDRLAVPVVRLSARSTTVEHLVDVLASMFSADYDDL